MQPAKKKFSISFKRPFAPHIFIWLGAAAAAFAVISQTPAPYDEIIGHALENPVYVLLEFIPILLFIYFLYYVTGVVWIAVTFPSAFVFIASVVNKIKVFLRGDPLMPADVIVGGEAFNIAFESSIRLGFGTIALLALIALACASLAIFARFNRPAARVRIIGAAAAAALAAASFIFIYSNDQVYNSIPIKHNIYNMVNEYNSKGLILAFTHHIKDMDAKSLRPDGYSASRAKDALDARNGSGHDRGGENNIGGGDKTQLFKPDVIILMSEAFWDITQIGSLDFSIGGGPGDPIPVFHNMVGDSITGELFTDVYGGGTDTTEFSVLTGHSVANFKNEVASAYKFLVRKDMDSIVRSFTGEGYAAVAMHPGYPWFYNRRNVYPWLGFHEFIDLGSFDEAADKSGNYISDRAMTDKLIELYEGYTGAGSAGPLFCFTVSIQNHGPYDAGFMYGETPVNYLTTSAIQLSIKSDYAVTNYVKGVADADESLGRLADYLDGSERPAVLLFFGDHLPGLGSNFAAYRELGYPIGYDGGVYDISNTYRGRYIIWANGAARKLWPEYDELKKTSRRMSAAYLGVFLRECLGLRLSPYEELAAAARAVVPVYHHRFYGTDGNDGAELFERPPGAGAETGLPQELAGILSEYGTAQYYKVFDEKLSANK